MPDRKRRREKQSEKQPCRQGQGRMESFWSRDCCCLWGTSAGTGFFLKDCGPRRVHTGAGETRVGSRGRDKLFCTDHTPFPTPSVLLRRE